MKCKRRISRYYRKIIALALTVPIVVTFATNAKAAAPYEVFLPLQKEANREISQTLQLKSIPTVFTCFKVLEIFTVLIVAGVSTRSSYQLVSEFLVSRAQVKAQKKLSEHSAIEVKKTKG